MRTYPRVNINGTSTPGLLEKRFPLEYEYCESPKLTLRIPLLKKGFN